MRIRIIKQPSGSTSGVDLQLYRPGQVYDVGAGLAEYLVAEGYAIVEMRDEERPMPLKPPRQHQRRRT